MLEVIQQSKSKAGYQHQSELVASVIQDVQASHKASNCVYDPTVESAFYQQVEPTEDAGKTEFEQP